MTKKILRYPDPFLRKPTSPWDFSKDPGLLHQMVDEMFGALTASDDGLALAANQIGHPWRVFVMNGSCGVFVNPTWEPKVEEGSEIRQESCLSFPGVSVPRTRWLSIEVTAQDQTGETFVYPCIGLEARAVQHECDHLNGKLMVDVLSSSHRTRIAKAMLGRK